MLSTPHVAGDLAPAHADPDPDLAAVVEGIADPGDPEAALVLAIGGDEEGLQSPTVIRAGTIKKSNMNPVLIHV